MSLLPLVGCADKSVSLPECWNNTDIELGYKIDGVAILEANDVNKPILLPLSCEGGGGPATLPDGLILSEASRNGKGPSSMGAHFYKARIEGKVVSLNEPNRFTFKL